MIRVRFVRDTNGRAEGEVRDYDEVSAQHLLDSGAAILASEQPEAAFDPGEHTVEEVLAHLDGAEAGEVERVRALEAAGKDRVSLRGDAD